MAYESHESQTITMFHELHVSWELMLHDVRLQNLISLCPETFQKHNFRFKAFTNRDTTLFFNIGIFSEQLTLTVQYNRLIGNCTCVLFLTIMAPLRPTVPNIREPALHCFKKILKSCLEFIHPKFVYSNVI